MNRPLIVAGVLVMLGVALPAAAQCTVSASGVAFGSYDVFSSSPRTSTGSVTYRCNVALTVQITLSTGNSGTYLPRTLTKGTEALQYNLYRDTAYLLIWGDSTLGTSVYTATLVALQLRKDIVVPIYGRIPAGQDVSAGAFADSVTVTINF